MDFVIRKMTIEDIDQVLEIEKSSFTTPWSRDAFVVEVTENMLAKYIVADCTYSFHFFSIHKVFLIIIYS